MLTPPDVPEPDAPKDAPTGASTSGADDHHKESEPRGLVGNVGALLGSRLIQAVLGWSGTLLIARTLSLEEFGRFTVIFTVLGLMSIVTDLGIGRIAVRGMLGEGKADVETFAGTYIALRSSLGIIGYLLALLVVIVAGYPREVVVAMAVAGTIVLLATPSAALDVVFQSRMRMGTVGAAEAVGITAQFALTAAIAAAGVGTVLLFTIPAVLFEIVVLARKIPAARRLIAIRPRIDFPVWRSLLREALPLSIGFGLATVYSRVDALMLSKIDGFGAVGIYGVSYRFIDVVHFVSTAVTVPLLTLLVRSWPDDLPQFRDVMRRGAMLLGLLGGLACVGLLGFARPLTGTLYGSDYTPGAVTTQVLVIAEMFTFAASLAMICLVAVDRNRGYPLVMLCGLIFNVALNFILIPMYSYHGAGVATLISNVFVTGVLVFFVTRIDGVLPIGLGRLVVAPVSIVGAVAVGWSADLVMPWVVAAAIASITYLGLVTALGLTKCAGIHLPPVLAGRKR